MGTSPFLAHLRASHAISSWLAIAPKYRKIACRCAGPQPASRLTETRPTPPHLGGVVPARDERETTEYPPENVGVPRRPRAPSGLVLVLVDDFLDFLFLLLNLLTLASAARRRQLRPQVGVPQRERRKDQVADDLVDERGVRAAAANRLLAERAGVQLATADLSSSEHTAS